MAVLIVKCRDLYGLWSTITDRPVSYLYDLEGFKKRYETLLIRAGVVPGGLDHLHQRLERVEVFGTSSVLGELWSQLLGVNRAGLNEAHFTEDEIVTTFGPGRRRFRAGDHVRHQGTRETWVLACDEEENDEIVCMGWPESYAPSIGCRLVKAADDDTRLRALRDVARITDQRRGSLARAQLEEGGHSVEA